MTRKYINLRVQEVLEQDVERDVYEYIIDRIDNLDYDPMERVLRVNKEQCSS